MADDTSGRKFSKESCPRSDREAILARERIQLFQSENPVTIQDRYNHVQLTRVAAGTAEAQLPPVGKSSKAKRRAAGRRQEAPLSFIIVALVNRLIHPLSFNASGSSPSSILSFHVSFVGLLDHPQSFPAVCFFK